MYTDISIDLETLGNKPGAVITQIGLAAFYQRPSSGGQASMAGLHIKVDPQSCLNAGLKIDWSTIAWWLTQDDAPRLAMARQGKNDNSLPMALTKVDQFATEMCGTERAVRVWGNGCGFDCTLLEMAYYACGRTPSWDFRNVRDLRTLAALLPAYAVNRPMPTVAHDALCDAMAQAEWIQRLTTAVEAREVRQFVD